MLKTKQWRTYASVCWGIGVVYADEQSVLIVSPEEVDAELIGEETEDLTHAWKSLLVLWVNSK